MKFTSVPSVLACVFLLCLSACGGSSGSSVVLPPPGPGPDIDAIIGSRDGDAIVIFRDILNGGGLGADVVLDQAGSGINSGGHLAVWNDWLAVSNRNINTVTLYNGISTLVNNQAPDVTLTAGSCLAAIQIMNGDLYVASRCSNQILIWRDITTLTSGDPADAVLSTGSCPADLKVVGDRLFVVSRCTSTSSIQIWDGASMLTGGEAPNANLNQNSPRRVEIHNNVMWVRTNGSGPVFGYSNANTLATGTGADRAIFGTVPTGDRGCFVADGNDGWLGHMYSNGDKYLARVSLTGMLITSPAATVSLDALGSAEIYDLQFVAETLVGTHRDASYAFYYRNARTLSTEQSPTGYLFDPRLSQAKDLVLIGN